MKQRMHNKHYTLSSGLVELFDSLPTTRSASMRAAVSEAFKDDQVLVTALVKRLISPRDQTPTTKVSVSWDEESEEKLNKLAERANLPVEHVLRLSMEAYISRRKASQSHKESQDETAGGVLHDGEGSAHPR